MRILFFSLAFYIFCFWCLKELQYFIVPDEFKLKKDIALLRTIEYITVMSNAFLLVILLNIADNIFTNWQFFTNYCS